MKYYSANGLLGRGAIFNQVYSDRSDGKTFDIKYRGIQRFKKHGFTTVYVRRWKTEFTKSMTETFLDEVLRVHPELDIYDIRASHSGIEVRPKDSKKDVPYQYMFYFVPISMSNKIKSNFDPTFIREIDFDEYVPLDHRYAQNEMMNLMELYRTCDRDRFIVKLVTFGNRVTNTTPFLNFFNLSLDLTIPRVSTYKHDTIAIQVYMNEEHREAVDKSPLALALENTAYESYMKGGILDNMSVVTRRKPSDAVVWCRFKTIEGEGSIWRDPDGIYYISDRLVDAHSILTDKPYGLPHETVASYTAFNTFFHDIYRTSQLYATSDRAWYLFTPILTLISLR